MPGNPRKPKNPRKLKEGEIPEWFNRTARTPEPEYYDPKMKNFKENMDSLRSYVYKAHYLPQKSFNIQEHMNGIIRELKTVKKMSKDDRLRALKEIKEEVEHSLRVLDYSLNFFIEDNIDVERLNDEEYLDNKAIPFLNVKFTKESFEDLRRIIDFALLYTEYPEDPLEMALVHKDSFIKGINYIYNLDFSVGKEVPKTVLAILKRLGVLTDQAFAMAFLGNKRFNFILKIYFNELSGVIDYLLRYKTKSANYIISSLEEILSRYSRMKKYL